MGEISILKLLFYISLGAVFCVFTPIALYKLHQKDREFKQKYPDFNKFFRIDVVAKADRVFWYTVYSCIAVSVLMTIIVVVFLPDIGAAPRILGSIAMTAALITVVVLASKHRNSIDDEERNRAIAICEGTLPAPSEPPPPPKSESEQDREAYEAFSIEYDAANVEARYAHTLKLHTDLTMRMDLEGKLPREVWTKIIAWYAFNQPPSKPSYSPEWREVAKPLGPYLRHDINARTIWYAGLERFYDTLCSSLPPQVRNYPNRPTTTPAIFVPWGQLFTSPGDLITALTVACEAAKIQSFDAYAGDLKRAHYSETAQFTQKEPLSIQQVRNILNFQDWPFKGMLDTLTPYIVPDATRFAHTTIIGTTGMGKTELVKALISADLDRVAQGECSVLLMDSQGDKELIGQVRRSKRFAPGGDLHGKLVYLTPDPRAPISLNIFALGTKRRHSTDARDQLLRENSVTSLLHYVMSSALGEDTSTTPMQATLVDAVIQLCLVIPGATLHTFTEICGLKTIERYADHVSELPPRQQEFFLQRFSNVQQFGKTKEGVAWRIDNLLNNKVFAAMLGAKECKLDLFEELNSPKVIIVNTDKALLQDGCGVFGRFILALLLQATQERADLKASDRLPVFCYIDEFGDYAGSSDGKKTEEMFDRARKQKVGLTCAFQRLSNIASLGLRDALLSAATKIANTELRDDARTLAGALHCEPEFIEHLPRYHFAAYSREVIRKCVSVAAKPVTFEPMTPSQLASIEREMFERYSLGVRRTMPPPKEAPKHEKHEDHEPHINWRHAKPDEPKKDETVIDADFVEVPKRRGLGYDKDIKPGR